MCHLGTGYGIPPETDVCKKTEDASATFQATYDETRVQDVPLDTASGSTPLYDQIEVVDPGSPGDKARNLLIPRRCRSHEQALLYPHLITLGKTLIYRNGPDNIPRWSCRPQYNNTCHLRSPGHCAGLVIT